MYFNTVLHVPLFRFSICAFVALDNIIIPAINASLLTGTPWQGSKLLLDPVVSKYSCQYGATLRFNVALGQFPILLADHPYGKCVFYPVRALAGKFRSVMLSDDSPYSLEVICPEERVAKGKSPPKTIIHIFPWEVSNRPDRISFYLSDSVLRAWFPILVAAGINVSDNTVPESPDDSSS